MDGRKAKRPRRNKVRLLVVYENRFLACLIEDIEFEGVYFFLLILIANLELCNYRIEKTIVASRIKDIIRRLDDI